MDENLPTETPDSADPATPAVPPAPASASAPAPADDARSGKPEDRVLRYLRKNITPALPEDMSPAIGIEVKPLKRLLGKMAREGTVRRSGGGRFTTSRFRRDA